MIVRLMRSSTSGIAVKDDSIKVFNIKNKMKQLMIYVLLLACSTVMFAQTSGQTKNKGSKQMQQGIYSCPMHPDMVSDKPGVCSRCDTKLVLRRIGSKALEHTAYS